MNRKLTLSMDEVVIEKAKRAAVARNTSVSAMVAVMVNTFDSRDRSRGPDFIGPLTRKATGLMTKDPNLGDRDLLGEALVDRFASVE